MKRKRLLVLSTALIYVFFVLLCLSYAFSLKHINSEYVIQGDSLRYQKVESLLADYKNKNLCFLDLDKITTKIEKNPYLKVDKIEKKYPNSINITVEERKEMFEITYQSSVYVLDENYFVLDVKSKKGDNIELCLDEKVFDAESLGIKKTLKFNNANIENCIKAMFGVFSDWKNLLSEVEVKKIGDYGDSFYSVLFTTTQGCVIEIQKASDSKLTEEKVLRAYEVYGELSDLEKTDTKIVSHMLYVNNEERIEADKEKILSGVNV